MQQQSRNKTQRRRIPVTPSPDMPTGPFETEKAVSATENSLEALFAAESETTFHQTWQRLDRGSRLNRLRLFVQNYTSPSSPSLSPAERASLLSAVLQAFELKQLNTKVAVDYDPQEARILSIRGLKERTTASGLKSFRVDTATSASARTTQRAKKSQSLNPQTETTIREPQ